MTRLPFERASFDFVGTLRTLHHVQRPEAAVGELVRVTRPGGIMLVVNQISPNDPLLAFELNRFEQVRDPTHERALADVDFRQLFEMNGLVLRRAEIAEEPRDLDPYLDLAGCEGEARERARALAPTGYTAGVAWYLLRRP
jgi:ubiquinone/menaquinone biosynthesis C-methylase UbiE